MGYNYISKETIEKIADDIRKDHLPSNDISDYQEVDIYQISKGLGCLIQIVEFEPSNISARIIKNTTLSNGKDKYIIQISKTDSFRRQKFSIAHEIAHLILHDNNPQNDSLFIELRQSIEEYTPEDLYKEVQANMLAAALLLPKEQVKRVWEASKSIDDVAETFNVSKKAAYNRLDNLGLLENE